MPPKHRLIPAEAKQEKAFESRLEPSRKNSVQDAGTTCCMPVAGIILENGGNGSIAMPKTPAAIPCSPRGIPSRSKGSTEPIHKHISSPDNCRQDHQPGIMG